MAGSVLGTSGSDFAIVRGYVTAGLFDRFDVRYVGADWDGNGSRKRTARIRAALSAWTRIVVGLSQLDEPLIHAHVSSRASWQGHTVTCLLAKAAGRPYLLHLHGREVSKFYREECGPRMQRLIRWLFKGSSLVLTPSEEARESVLQIWQEAKVEVLMGAEVPPEGDATLEQRLSATASSEHLGRIYQRFGILMRTNIR